MTTGEGAGRNETEDASKESDEKREIIQGVQNEDT